MEHDAFVRLLAARTTIFDDGVIAFQLYKLQIPGGTPDNWLIERNGARFLRLDCLGKD